MGADVTYGKAVQAKNSYYENKVKLDKWPSNEPVSKLVCYLKNKD